MSEIKLYKSKKKVFKLLLITIPFIAIGIWMIFDETSNKTMAWFITCFFGLGLLVSLFFLLDKRPQVIINEIGIFDRTTHSEFINWEIIIDAYPMNIYDQHFICLLVPENFKPSKKKIKFHKVVAKLNEGIGAQELNIQLGLLDIDALKLTEFIIAMTRADKSKKAKLLKMLSS